MQINFPLNILIMKNNICTLLLSLCYCVSSYCQDYKSGYIMIDGLYYNYFESGDIFYTDFHAVLNPLPDNVYYKGDIYIPDYVIIDGIER